MSISRKEQLEILRKMKEEDIDYSDAPPLSDHDLQRMAPFVPPEKRMVTIRLDADVLSWLKKQQPKGYQTLINAVIRDYMHRHKDTQQG